MKRLLFVLFSIFSCISIMRGEQLAATLQSGDATKVFYGFSALVEAYAEASDGDVITLSKGNFQKVNIEKSITLRGSGAFVEGESTAIANLSIDADQAVIEGICFTSSLTVSGNSLQILRCNIKNFKEDSGTLDLYLADCAIEDDETTNQSVNTTYKNCAIRLLHSHKNLPTFDNCVVRLNEYSYSSTTNTISSQGYFFNCILIPKNSDSPLIFPSPNQFYNTLIYYTDRCVIRFEDGVQREKCITIKLTEEEFKNRFGIDKFPYFFAEKAAGPDVPSFICGVVDHKEWPAIPRVVESNIAKETDESGHLKVGLKIICEK